jgi:hypothetical protein
MNPMQIIKGFMTKGMTPKGIVKNMIGNNPILGNLVEMADRGDTKGVETFARNLLKERGLDFDKEMANMKKTLNIQ